MSLIKNPYEIKGKKSLVMMIYGQPGVGKSTIACSAPKPVLFDFDGGVTRMQFEHQVPTVQMSTFRESEDALKEVADAGNTFETIIVDTGGKMFECIQTSLCGIRNPKIHEYGTMNSQFAQFLLKCRTLRKNVIIICHVTSEKAGDGIIYQPALREANFKGIVCDLDLMGYAYIDPNTGKRHLRFAPTAENVGKKTGCFKDSYELPVLTAGIPNDFLSTLFQQYQDAQDETEMRKAEFAKGLQVAEEFGKKLAMASSADEFNILLDEVKEMANIGDCVLRCKTALNQAATAKGLKYNKKEGGYE